MLIIILGIYAKLIITTSFRDVHDGGELDAFPHLKDFYHLVFI